MYMCLVNPPFNLLTYNVLHQLPEWLYSTIKMHACLHMHRTSYSYKEAINTYMTMDHIAISITIQVYMYTNAYLSCH